jgi:hypothetical protein
MIYADFQNLDDFNRLRLTAAGTVRDLERQGIQLHEGLLLTLYTDDEDDLGQPHELRAEGVAHFDAEGQCWVATIDWTAVRHASDEAAQDARQSAVAGSSPISRSTATQASGQARGR